MQINLSHRGQTRGASTGVWQPAWARRDGRHTRAVLYYSTREPHLPPEPISQLPTFVQPAWRTPVPSQPCTAPRSRGQSSRSQENRKSLLSAGGWAATQSHHLCLSSAACTFPAHSLLQHQLHRLTSPVCRNIDGCRWGSRSCSCTHITTGFTYNWGFVVQPDKRGLNYAL